MLRLRTIFPAVLTVLLAGTGYAGVILTANLTNAQENPPTNPTTDAGVPRTSFGTASFFINDAMTSMTFTATIFGIDFTGSQTPDMNDNLVAAHIHAAPTVTPTTNGPVVWGFFGMPVNDNNPNDVVITPFLTGIGGTISGKWDAPEGMERRWLCSCRTSSRATRILTSTLCSTPAVRFAGSWTL